MRPCCRRFDKWPVWKIPGWTNPVVIGLLRGWKRAVEGLVPGRGSVGAVAGPELPLHFDKSPCYLQPCPVEVKGRGG